MIISIRLLILLLILSASHTAADDGLTLGVTVTGGGRIVAKMVLVKSDGTLTIHAMSGGAATGGGGWVRLME